MKVRLLKRRVGKAFVQRVGTIIDVDEESATRLVAMRQAELVPDEIETAAIAGSPLKEATSAKTIHTATTSAASKRAGNKGRPKRTSEDRLD